MTAARDVTWEKSYSISVFQSARELYNTTLKSYHDLASRTVAVTNQNRTQKQGS